MHIVTQTLCYHLRLVTKIAFGHATCQHWAFRVLGSLRTQVSQHLGLRFSYESNGNTMSRTFAQMVLASCILTQSLRLGNAISGLAFVRDSLVACGSAPSAILIVGSGTREWSKSRRLQEV